MYFKKRKECIHCVCSAMYCTLISAYAETVGSMLSAQKTCFNSDKSVSLSIVMCIPEAGEQCPVSLEPIGYPGYIPPFNVEKQKKALNNKGSSNKRPKLSHAVEHAFSDCPTLACAQIANCGHRFDARALVTHFLCNAMNCPLCRAGHPSSTLSAIQSFPQEKWICSMEEAITKEAERERNDQLNEDILLAARLQQTMDYLSLPNLILNTLLDHTISASLFFFDSPVNDRIGDYPIHGMQFELELQPVHMHHRDLPRGISLYSSFSSSSIATPHYQDVASTPLVLRQGSGTHPHQTAAADDANAATYAHAVADSSTSNDNSNSRTAVHLSHVEPVVTAEEGSDANNAITDINFIMMGNNIYSLNDVSVQYAMSEATLRFILN
jgi:hypothetical protein